MARLRHLIADRAGAVIAGAAGVGKTALVAAAIDDGTRERGAIVHARATRSAHALPFGAFAALLPPDEPWPRGMVNEAAVLRRIARAFVEAAADRRLLLIVDDVHFLDDASAALIHHLATSESATVVVTMRTGFSVPDAITALWSDGVVERIDLAALGPADIEALLAEVLGAPIDPTAVRQLSARSAGNPLFLRELVLEAVDSGSLRREHGLWQLAGPLRASARLTELIRLRVEQLDEPERDLLQMVALHEPLGTAEIGALSDSSVAESLERKSMSAIRVDGRRAQVWLAHPLYGEVARATISPLRQRELSRRLAAVVEGLGRRRREDALVVATWRLVAGGGDPDVLLAGAQVARARNDAVLAGRLAAAAAEAGGGFPAHFAIAEAAYQRGDEAAVNEKLLTLHSLATTDVERTRVAALECDVAIYLRGKPDISILDRGALTVEDPTCLEELASRRLTVLWLTKGVAAVVEAAEQILADADPDKATYSWFAGARAISLTGQLNRALDLLDRPRQASGVVTGGAWYEGLRNRYKAVVLSGAGRIAEADALLSDAYDRAVDDRNEELQALFAVGLAQVRVQQGRVRASRQLAEEGLRLFTALGRRIMMREPLMQIATAAALMGDRARAAAALDELDALDTASYADDSDRLRAKAFLALAEGDNRRAVALLREAATEAETTGNRMGAMTAWHQVARLGDPRLAEPYVAALAAEIEGDLAQTRLLYTRGAARRDAKLLGEAGEGFERLGLLLLAAESFNEAAVVERRHGETRAAAANAQRAARLVARCEGASTPALGDVDARAALTPAELDTARLAARGGSNKAIADSLHVSVRTVENRLQRIYGKLGISSRRDLGGALGE